MNSALVFHVKTSLKNMVKRMLKRPLKAIGILVIALYFLAIPFTMKSFLIQFGFATPKGFVLLITAMTLYISMPSTMTYFKRRGVIFRKQDVNFMFASPLPPKQILLYALMKQAYMSVLMQIVGFIAAFYIFEIPFMNAIIYSVCNVIFSSILSYSLAIIMYGSERLSDTDKRNIKYGVYIAIVVVTVFLGYFIFKNGVSVESAQALVTHPVVLAIPIFGWELAWLNLIVLGPTVWNSVFGALFIISSISLGIIAYRMECTGQYYEDAIKFSEHLTHVESKKGNASFSEMVGNKQKIHTYNGKLKGTLAKTIFSRQFIERRRVRKYFISFGDLITLVLGIAVGIFAVYMETESSYYFLIACGVSLYITVFFTPANTWRDEFERYFLFIIPDTMWNKLLYSTMLEHFISLIRAVFIAIPIGIIMRASVMDVVYVIIAQVLLKAMIIYKTILIDGYIGAKLGAGLSQLISMVVSALVVIVPLFVIVLASMNSTLYSFIFVSGYSLAMCAVFMYLCVRTLTNLESLND